MTELLIGYALGTAQILGIEWVRERRAHRKALRSYCAELIRLQEFHTTFGWKRKQVPDSDAFPKAPSMGVGFWATVGGIDWTLTDEHRDDSSQLAAITIGDLCDSACHYHARVMALLDDLKTTQVPQSTLDVLEEAIDYAKLYDREVDQFQYVITDALRDARRRLVAGAFWPQLKRTLTRLPPGKNPVPVTPDDPRVIGFADRIAAARKKAS